LEITPSGSTHQHLSAAELKKTKTMNIAFTNLEENVQLQTLDKFVTVRRLAYAVVQFFREGIRE
jgi:hypothetical protein